MSDAGFWGSVILILLCLVIAFIINANQQRKEIAELQRQAVVYQYAEWVVDENGVTEFQWVKPEE